MDQKRTLSAFLQLLDSVLLTVCLDGATVECKSGYKEILG